MKKLLLKSLMMMSAMLAVVIGFTSCGGDDDEDSTPMLTVSNPNLSVDVTGGSISFQVISNTKWIASSGASWCTVSPQSGDGDAIVDVTASENTSTTSRTCTIRIRTNDGSLSQDVTVEQSGAGVSLTVTESLEFTSEKGNSKNLKIECNTEWNISGKPDWLDATDFNGKGDATITFYTLSANNTATPRTATMTVTAGSESKSVSVTQAAGLSSVSVTPNNLVALSNCFAYLPKISGNVKSFKVGWIRADYIDKWSDDEILEWLDSGDADVIIDFDKIQSMSGLSPNTEYYLVTLATDKSDKKGEVVKTKFKTRGDGDEQSDVTIGTIYRHSDEYIYWTAEPNGSTDKYYTMFLCGLQDSEFEELFYISNESYSFDFAKIAWILNNEIQNNSSVYKVKKGTAEIYEYTGYTLKDNRVVEENPSVQNGWTLCVTWGVNVSDGDFSGIININYGSLSVKSPVKKTKLRLNSLSVSNHK